MKMARASKADMDMALTLCSALESVDRQYFPEGSEAYNGSEELDLHDDQHCGLVLRKLAEILKGGSIGRVIRGMYVLLDPNNNLVDPNADTLEPHPDTVANEKNAERYEALRRGQKWSVVDGIGNTLRAETLDAAIDAALAQAAAEQAAQ